MAAVIRAAVIDPDRLLLKMRGTEHVARAVAQRADGAVVESAARAAESRPIPEWTPPPAPISVEAPPLFDRETEDRSFREQLASEREAVLKQASEEGYAAGLHEGRQEYEARIEGLGAMIGSIRGALAEEISGTEDVIVEIAFEAVCKILGEAVANRDGAVAIVREILRAAVEREKLLLRVAPADYELVLRHRSQLLPGDDGRTLDVVSDERVVLGGCLVETTGGTLDGRLETQLQRLVDTLASARRMQLESPG